MELADWMSVAPAMLARLQLRKGTIRVGSDADLVIWNPEAEWIVDAARLQQRHKLTPYAGRRLRGRVQTTFVRGTPVWDAGRLVTGGSGRLL
jgi:allantoinase